MAGTSLFTNSRNYISCTAVLPKTGSFLSSTMLLQGTNFVIVHKKGGDDAEQVKKLSDRIAEEGGKVLNLFVFCRLSHTPDLYPIYEICHPLHSYAQQYQVTMAKGKWEKPSHPPPFVFGQVCLCFFFFFFYVSQATTSPQNQRHVEAAITWRLRHTLV